MSTRLQSALEENRVVENRLKDIEATLRARILVNHGEPSDLYSYEIRTSTATSPDRKQEEHPLVESHPTGRTPSPSSSANDAAS